MRALCLLFAACLVLPPLAGDSSVEKHAPEAHIQEARASSNSAEKVSFNTSSLKYHCRTCTWAKKCTTNCISITKSEAVDRGGVACKVCRGTCK